MGELPMRTGLDLPSADGPLARIASAALQARGALAPPPPETDRALFPASQFGLDRARAFRDLPEAGQQRVLAACGRQLLEESYYIEKAGLAFAAKMALLAETVEERLLYCAFAADEAAHFQAVRAYVPAPTPASEQPFLGFLEALIDEAPRDVLVLVIQVVLEGWGLAHYRELAEACEDEALRAVFESILRDEARHHGSGLVLLEQRGLNDAAQEGAVAALADFLGMVQCGPQGVVGALAAELGGLSTSERAEAFAELGCEAHSGARLERLRRLLRGAPAVVAELEARGCFRPWAPEECA